MRGWGIALAAMGAILAAVAVLVVFAVLGGDRIAVSELEVGECFELPDSDDDGTAGELVLVERISCDDPHLFEVVSDGDLPGDGELPADEELFTTIEAECRQAAVVSSDDFGLLPVAPTAERWERGDTRYLCVAIPFGGELVTGSATATASDG